MRSRRLSPAAVLGAVLLAGCALPVSVGGDELACRAGDDGEPASGVVLMAQAVPTASDEHAHPDRRGPSPAANDRAFTVTAHAVLSLWVVLVVAPLLVALVAAFR